MKCVHYLVVKQVLRTALVLELNWLTSLFQQLRKVLNGNLPFKTVARLRHTAVSLLRSNWLNRINSHLLNEYKSFAQASDFFLS